MVAAADTEKVTQRPRLAHIVFTALLTMVVAADGFDLQVAPLAAPAIADQFRASREAMTPLLTAGLIGWLFGAPVLGWLGDRLGRKPPLLAGCVLFGVATLFCARAGTLDALTGLRVLAGFGLGGVLPNALALISELSAERHRSASTAFVTIGMMIGGTIAGLTNSQIAPGDWRTLFWFGGWIPLICAALVALSIPESPMITTRPRLTSGSISAAATSRSFKALFSGGYASVTPFVWLCFASSLLTIFFITTWLPLLLQNAGMQPQRASGMAALLQLGGIAGSVVMTALLRPPRFGYVAGMLAFAIAGLGSVLIVGVASPALDIAVAFCGFTILGAQTGITASTALLYPSPIRAIGTGSALGVARLGSILGPVLGGVLVAGHLLSIKVMFLVVLAPISLTLLAALAIARWESSRFDMNLRSHVDNSA